MRRRVFPQGQRPAVDVPGTHSPQPPQVLLERARRENATHRAVHQKPISAENLRIRLGIGASKARKLVAVARSEAQAQVKVDLSDAAAASSAAGAETTLVA